MGKVTRVLLLGVLAVLWGASPAHADMGRVALAQSIALKRTGPVCTADGGQVTVSRSVDVRGLAQARYDHPWDGADNRTAYYNCRVTFRLGRIPWQQFCHAMVHEYLHLAAWRARAGDEYVGRREDGTTFLDPMHSRTPTSLMYVRPERIYFRCRSKPSAGPSLGMEPVPPPRSAPTVILLPGGGWQHADAKSMEPWVRDFRAHGIRAYATSYPTRDVPAAINYVRSLVHAERGPVVVYGISAGGTIAAALAAEGSVAGAVNVVGPTDFTRWLGMGMVYMQEIGMRTYAQKRAASPYWRLRAGASPQLIQCGIADPLVTFEQCLRYESAAKRYQPDTRLDALVNAHGQFPRERAIAREWVAAHLMR